LSELGRCFDQIVRGAIAVRFAVEVTAAPGREANDGTHRWWILAGKRDRTPTATRLTDDYNFISLDEWLDRHVFDHPSVKRGNRQAGISKIGVRTIPDTREKEPEQASLGNFDRGGYISWSYRRDDDVTLPRNQTAASRNSITGK
jgi:hypothetical protein